jgi:hypothetical protein
MNLAAKYPARQSSSSENCSNEASDATDFDSSAFAESVYSDEETNYGDEVKGHHDKDYEIFMENFVNSMKGEHPSSWTDEYLENLIKDKPRNKKYSLQTLKRLIATLRVKDTSHWDELRKQAYIQGYRSGTGVSDLVDWEAVLHASPAEVARYIAVRGMNYVIACRIQVCDCKIHCHLLIYNTLIPKRCQSRKERDADCTFSINNIFNENLIPTKCFL